MPSLVGPSHHLFYASLHRQRVWLEHLARAFAPFADPDWTRLKTTLDTAFGRMFAKLSGNEHLGILRPLQLQEILDDTPVDSFLSGLSDELDDYERKLFELMEKHAMNPGWVDELEQTSMLWGREIAQECMMSRRMSPRQGPRSGVLVPGGADGFSVRGAFELFQNVLQGGDFSWKPLLLRRYTDRELQYEVRGCPHRKGMQRACHMESMVFAGFVQAILPGARFQRHDRETYCLDELELKL